MSTTLDIRGLQAAPPYLEDEGTEVAWLRADLATTPDEARITLADLNGMTPEDSKDLVAKGPVGMKPDPKDEFHERWILCPDDEASARYWQVSFA